MSLSFGRASVVVASIMVTSIASLTASAPTAHAQQSADPDASPGGVLPVPYIVPHTETVEPVSRSDTKHFKRSYVRRKAAERDTLMVLANALPVTPSTATTQTASAAFTPRRVAVAPSPATRLTPVPAPRAAAPAYTTPTDGAVDGAHETPTDVASAPVGNAPVATAAPSDAVLDQPTATIPDDVPDTTSTVADSTGEYFIIRPVLEGTQLRRSTADRLVGLATEYAKRSLDVTYIIAVEAAPNDDAATDQLLNTADLLRRELIDAGAAADRVIVRDAPPTGPRSAIRILLRGPHSSATQPASMGRVVRRPAGATSL